MTSRPLRVLVLGVDPGVWLALSDASSARPLQMFVTEDVHEAPAAPDVDVVIVPLEPSPAAALRALEALARRNLTARTIVLAYGHGDRARHVVSLGVAAYVSSGLNRLGAIVEHVAGGGVHYDPPAADLARGTPPARWHVAATETLAAALEIKDAYTGGHAERVTALALRLAAAAAPVGDRAALEAAFLLHDVGKIGIPDSILTKPGPLTERERTVLETHPVLGERIIAPMGFPPVVGQVVRHHHEHWDGSGYPDGLAREEIPFPARIFALADAIDAMTSGRPYRPAVGFEEAIRRVLMAAGTQFDPALSALAEEVFLDDHVELLRNSGLFEG